MKKKKHYINKQMFRFIFISFGIVYFLILIWGNLCIFHTLRREKENETQTEIVDYIMILGNQMNHNILSELSLLRLNGAIELLKKCPQSKIILTGGILGNNTSSEAEVMSDYLIKHNIDKSRIILEEVSQNTRQNFSFCKKLINPDSKIIVVTNGFHMYRSLEIAHEMGYTNISGYSVSDGSLSNTIKNHLIEPFPILFNYIARLFGL